MKFDIGALIGVIDAANTVYQSALRLAEDAATTANEQDQRVLKELLTSLRAENKAGFHRLDDKLSAIAAKGTGNG